MQNNNRIPTAGQVSVLNLIHVQQGTEQNLHTLWKIAIPLSNFHDLEYHM